MPVDEDWTSNPKLDGFPGSCPKSLAQAKSEPLCLLRCPMAGSGARGGGQRGRRRGCAIVVT